MLFLNVKIPSFRRWLLWFFVAVVTVILLIALLKGTQPTVTSTVNISDEFSPADYITSFGPEVDASALRVDEVTVPSEFSEVYISYNNIQKSQGFDLEKYKGVTLKRYTYPVTNYPDETQSVYVEVLVFDGVVVAADIYSTDSDGFISALK